MAWVTISNTDIDADSPITVALMTALRDNVAAMGAGDAGAPPITSALGRLIAVTDLTSSGTHNLNADTRLSVALLIGGGGPGGAGTTSGAGMGGQAGEYRTTAVVRTGGEALTVTIGSGGGTTSLTGHVSALGGRTGTLVTANIGGHGASCYGRGGAGGASTSNGSAAAANTGAGGGGGGGNATTTGGAGGSGRIIIWEFA